jgi:hypothetical protein
MRRSQQRRAAVVALYQHDLTGRPLADTFSRNDSEFVRSLAHAAADRAPELDEIIDSHSKGWAVGRIQPLERSIMRVAVDHLVQLRRAVGRRVRQRAHEHRVLRGERLSQGPAGQVVLVERHHRRPALLGAPHR